MLPGAIPSYFKQTEAAGCKVTPAVAFVLFLGLRSFIGGLPGSIFFVKASVARFQHLLRSLDFRYQVLLLGQGQPVL